MFGNLNYIIKHTLESGVDFGESLQHSSKLPEDCKNFATFVLHVKV